MWSISAWGTCWEGQPREVNHIPKLVVVVVWNGFVLYTQRDIKKKLLEGVTLKTRLRGKGELWGRGEYSRRGEFLGRG